MLALRLKKGCEKPVLSGFPWAFSGEITESSEQALAEPGELAELRTHKDELLGIGTFNAQASIAFRMLTRTRETIDAAFFRSRIDAALARRNSIPVPYYRLIHSEADGIPGLVVDRFGDTLVLQVATAGMGRLLPLLLEALDATIGPSNILLRNDISSRTQEGLPREVKVIRGTIPPLTEVQENGITYLADLTRGQKTGWFFDQRANRRLIADHAAGKTLLDVFSHSGGFGLLAAANSAEVTMVDSSALALSLALRAAERNNIASCCTTIEGDAAAVMQKLAGEGRRYGIVVSDPPAYIKSKKDLAAGLKGYAKITKLSAALVEEGGLLMVAACSHHATRPRFRDAVLAGVREAGRSAEILAYTGHDADHPLHPQLPQSEYLKALLLRVMG